VGGGLVGLITGPRLLVLIMALLAGWSVGGLVGKLAWAETGHLAGALTGALLGALTWGVWLLGRRASERTGRA
jgi:high-affinity Fe2+/Pb2+ permease